MLLLIPIIALLKYGGIFTRTDFLNILFEDNNYGYNNQNVKANLNGLLGELEKKEGESYIFLRKTNSDEIEVAEINENTLEINTFISTSKLSECMEVCKEKYGKDYDGRISNIKYMKKQNAMSFIWNDGIYMLYLDSFEVEQLIASLGIYKRKPDAITENIIEGRVYGWLDQENIVYVHIDDIYSIRLYNIRTKKEKLVSHGLGVYVNDELDIFVCYDMYIKDATMWDPHYELNIFDSHSLKNIKTLKVSDKIMYKCCDNDIIVWFIKNSNIIYIYDYQNDIVTKKVFWKKRIYSVL